MSTHAQETSLCPPCQVDICTPSQVDICTQCQAEENDGTFFISGTFRVRAAVASSPAELDQLIELADQIGQAVKQTVAVTSLEVADRRVAQFSQETMPHLHKHGSRPFTLVTKFGRLKLKRIRLRNSQTGQTIIEGIASALSGAVTCRKLD